MTVEYLAPKRSLLCKLAGAGASTLWVMLLAACTLEPTYRAPALPVSQQWPIPPVVSTTQVQMGTASKNSDIAFSDIGWREFFVDPHLQELIAEALANNRDLRVSILNVQSAQAQYRITRADQFPTITADGSYLKQKLPPALNGGAPAVIIPAYEVDLGLSAFEIDLFGRVRSLSHAALETYLSQEETRRNAQLVLIAEVANAYLTLAADSQSRELADNTLKSQSDSLNLTQNLFSMGAVSELDLDQARTTVESARVDSAHYEGNVKQDIDALTLLVGKPIDERLLPQSLQVPVTGLMAPPADLSSTVLLRRPDILAAEHVLRSANANIGAARAAFFPTISLTASGGSASEQLSSLFGKGTQTWTLAPQISVPIFEGGRLRAALQSSHVDHDIALAQYEKAIQSGFRDVADALALSQTLTKQQQAEDALVDASSKAYALSQRRFQAGRDSYLVVLDSQRGLYTAQQGQIAVRLAEQTNRVNLYKALGGGWLEHTR